jgi:hypothetical protein
MAKQAAWRNFSKDSPSRFRSIGAALHVAHPAAAQTADHDNNFTRPILEPRDISNYARPGG